MNFTELIRKKIIYDYNNINHLLALWNFKNYKKVFTNGCFDILHRGHIEYLIRASQLGDILIIGLNTDNSVKRLKGESRPINDQESRALILASFNFVNFVILFEEDTPLNLIKIVKPNILVKGGDYTPENIVGYDFVKSYGGKVTTLPYIEGYSTTNIIKKLNNVEK